MELGRGWSGWGARERGERRSGAAGGEEVGEEEEGAADPGTWEGRPGPWPRRPGES